MWPNIRRMRVSRLSSSASATVSSTQGEDVFSSPSGSRRGQQFLPAGHFEQPFTQGCQPVHVGDAFEGRTNRLIGRSPPLGALPQQGLLDPSHVALFAALFKNPLVK